MPLLLPYAHQAGFPKDPKMARHARLADMGKSSPQLAGGPLSSGEKVEHLSTRWIGQGREHITLHAGVVAT